MSFQSETPQMKSRNNPRRMPPSIRLKTIRPPRAGLIFLSSVAASSGMYLYMKMKKASEITILTAASQLLSVAAFSRLWDFEDSEDPGFPAALCFGGTAEAGCGRRGFF